MSQNLLIVGAGIGGLTAAAVLLERGHRVRVYEQAPALGEIGAGIQISAKRVARPARRRARRSADEGCGDPDGAAVSRV
jgi:salicylate hydroxylase